MSDLEQWRLKVPPGIDSEVARGLVKLLERWDNVGVEKVLVWHLASVEESALPHLAQAMGVDKVAFIGVPPRELLARGIDLMRRRGTPAAMQEALEALGCEDVEIVEGGERVLDGSWELDGTFSLGGDNWAVFFVFVRETSLYPGDVARELDGSWELDGSVSLGADAERVTELIDVIEFMRPARCQLGALVRTNAEGVRDHFHRR